MSQHVRPPSPQKRNDGARVARVAAIMEQLRAEEGCPWTRAQTLATLWPYLIEEAHEAAHAARSSDWTGLKEELGDVLLQVAYLSEIAEQEGHFTLGDVADGLSDKLIRRHPHVFAKSDAADAQDVSRRWEEIKAQERAAKSGSNQQPQGRLSGIAPTLPALLYAQTAADKAAGLGFDWPDVSGPLAKVREELQEVEDAMGHGASGAGADPRAVQEELGDLLFSVVNVCRHMGVVAEGALHEATEKFGRRFAHVEQRFLALDPAPGPTGTLDDLQRLWDEAKALKL